MSEAEHPGQEISGDRLAERAEAALSAERLQEAVALFNRAEPNVEDADRCAGGRWMAQMLLGDFAAAWRESDAIRQRGRPDPHRFWLGEKIAGCRVILRSLHGFGDAVQMFRFLPRLRGSVRHLIVEVPPRLVELAPCFAGMGEVITWGPGAPARVPDWDVQMEVMELPYLLRVTVEDLAPQQGYLRLPSSARARAASIMRKGRVPRVGLVWSAGHWNPSRSVPFALLESLLQVEGVEFWSLQGEADREGWLAAGTETGRRCVYEVGDGILNLAAAIEQLDLVLTVDTLAAHLAGALGVPCWVLLQHRADWRWMCQRPDSPWYPSLRLLRQQGEGDWEELVGRTRELLVEWVRSGAWSRTMEGAQRWT